MDIPVFTIGFARRAAAYKRYVTNAYLSPDLFPKLFLHSSLDKTALFKR